MKQGRTLSELAAELERQHTFKRDFITDTRNLELVPHLKSEESSEAGISESLRLKSDTNGTLEFSPTQTTHRQLGTFLGIPAKYYDRMRQDAPALLAHNVNHWFKTQPAERMVRTLDGKARAFLSNRYRRLDNFDLLHAVMPVLAELKDDKGTAISTTPTLEVAPDPDVMGYGFYIRDLKTDRVIYNNNFAPDQPGQSSRGSFGRGRHLSVEHALAQLSLLVGVYSGAGLQCGCGGRWVRCAFQTMLLWSSTVTDGGHADRS